MQFFRFLITILIFGVLFSGCSSSGTGTEGGGEEEPERYSLSVRSNPSDGGSVDPSNGSFEEGTTVTVEAIASEGWQFTGWTGDINSSESPLSFNINSDTDLDANFEQLASEYTFSLTVEDADDSIELAFGQTEGATNGFENGMDKEAPPPPPKGALNAFFKGQDRKLLDDFRSHTANTITWILNYQIGSGDNLTLAWSVDDTMLIGSVTITDTGDSFEIDMLNESEFSFVPSEYEQLLIEYHAK